MVRKDTLRLRVRGVVICPNACGVCVRKLRYTV